MPKPTGACGKALETEPQAFGEDAEEHRRTTVESAAERVEEKPGESFVFGAFHDGRLVGTAGFFRYAISKARHKGRIWGVYVREDCRGQGVGRALLSALLEKIKGCAGVEQVSLTVVGEQAPAIALYRSLGFQTYGHETRGLKVGERYFDNEHMALRLSKSGDGAIGPLSYRVNDSLRNSTRRARARSNHSFWWSGLFCDIRPRRQAGQAYIPGCTDCAVPPGSD